MFWDPQSEIWSWMLHLPSWCLYLSRCCLEWTPEKDLWLGHGAADSMSMWWLMRFCQGGTWLSFWLMVFTKILRVFGHVDLAEELTYSLERLEGGRCFLTSLVVNEIQNFLVFLQIISESPSPKTNMCK